MGLANSFYRAQYGPRSLGLFRTLFGTSFSKEAPYNCLYLRGFSDTIFARGLDRVICIFGGRVVHDVTLRRNWAG